MPINKGIREYYLRACPSPALSGLLLEPVEMKKNLLNQGGYSYIVSSRCPKFMIVLQCIQKIASCDVFCSSLV